MKWFKKFFTKFTKENLIAHNQQENVSLERILAGIKSFREYGMSMDEFKEYVGMKNKGEIMSKCCNAEARFICCEHPYYVCLMCGKVCELSKMENSKNED